MKLKCNDGIVRRFQVSKDHETETTYGPIKNGTIDEAYCMECGTEFGCHDLKIIKEDFKKHICIIKNAK
jgi:hypothetical protein